MRTAMLTLLVVSVPLVTTNSRAEQAAAQVYTGGSLNCRVFRPAPRDYRIGYLMGFDEGFAAGLIEMGRAMGSPPEMSAIFDAKLGGVSISVGDLDSSVTSFCAVPENAAITLRDAIGIIRRKFNGATPEEVESRTVFFRKYASEAGQSSKRGQ
ncbi:MAG: hypothetical protein WDO73_25225 [Ignavibacteriota bacterium]